MAVFPILKDQKPYPEVDEGASSLPGLSLANNTSPALAANHAKISSAPAPVGFVQDKTSAFKSDPAKMSPAQSGASAALYGIQAAGQVPATENVGMGVTSTLGSAATGAAAGFMVGGPVGAAVGGGIGLVLGGMNAFFGNQQARKERDRLKRLQDEANKKYAEEVARDEKWRQTYRLDNLEEARYQRRKYEGEKAFEQSMRQGQSILAHINNNSVLRERYKKQGWV